MIAALPLVSSALSALSSGGGTAAVNAANAANSAGTDFSQVLSKVSNDVVQSMNGAESASMQALKGDANPQTVVQSVMSAQESLQTALAIRDKSVSAFQEITRMSI